MGIEAFRSFVQELDATTIDHSSCLLSLAAVPATTNRNDNDHLGRHQTHTPNTSHRYGYSPMDPRRTLLKRRLEAAESLARPFALRLEADGVSSVKVLARVPVRTWSLPACLVEQAERMLGLLAAKFCATECFPYSSGSSNTSEEAQNASTYREASTVVRGRRNEGSVVAGAERGRVTRNGSGRKGQGGNSSFRSSSVRTQQKTMLFDPKFQRSALDPFGRPPRLECIQPCSVGAGRGHRSSCHHPPLNEDNCTSSDGLPPPLRLSRAAEQGGEDDTHVDLLRGVWGQPGGFVPTVQGSDKDETLADSGSILDRPKIAENNGDLLLSDPSPTVAVGDEAMARWKGFVLPMSDHNGSCVIDELEAQGQAQRQRRQLGDLRRQRAPSGRWGCHGKKTTVPAPAHTDGTSGFRSGVVDPTTTEVNYFPYRNAQKSKFTCQLSSGCGAGFTRTCTLLRHEQSHDLVPEYHRLRRAPQLFRDSDTAPWEGAGASCAKFRLRTELPASVRQELLYLQQEGATRQRSSFLALPGLPGAMATWAGVATPSQTVDAPVENFE